MAVEQGSFNVTQQMLNTGHHQVTLAGTPTNMTATVRRGQAGPLRGRGLFDKQVIFNGTTATFSMGFEQVGNTISWTAYS